MICSKEPVVTYLPVHIMAYPQNYNTYMITNHEYIIMYVCKKLMREGRPMYSLGYLTFLNNKVELKWKIKQRSKTNKNILTTLQL